MTFTAETVVGAESVFSGRMTGEDLHVLGRFEGDLEVKGVLRIGPQAVVKATVQAAAVEVKGEFEGEIRAQTITFAETARARGIFRMEKITIKEGAVVDGSVNVGAAALAQPSASVPEVPVPAAEPFLETIVIEDATSAPMAAGLA